MIKYFLLQNECCSHINTLSIDVYSFAKKLILMNLQHTDIAVLNQKHRNHISQSFSYFPHPLCRTKRIKTKPTDSFFPVFFLTFDIKVISPYVIDDNHWQVVNL